MEIDEETLNKADYKEKRNLNEPRLKTFATKYGFTMDEIHYLKKK